MKQYTSPEQTAKLIELGFKKPPKKGLLFQSNIGGCLTDLMLAEENYSIGELIEMLPKEINDGLQSRLGVYIDHNKMWAVDYSNILGELCSTYHTELIDALYDMIVKLKEEGVI